MRRTARELRQGNRFDILRRLYRSADVSRHDIAHDTGLSFATVSNTISELLELGMLVEAGYASSGGGRPRTLIAVNAHRGALIGVDVAETYVHAEAFDLRLRSLATVEQELHPQDNQPDDVVTHIVEAVQALLNSTRLTPADVLGVGVSLPGQVDREAGVSVYAPNWNWHDVPVGTALTTQLGLPLYLDNPLKASTVAELWFGAGRDADDLVVVTLGTGVGAGFAFGGSLHRGITNSAGEWGHTTLVLDGRLCHCGSHGCVEAYVGAGAIMHHLRELAPDSALLHSGDQTATINALAHAADRDDPVAHKVIADTARHLGAGIANLVNILNPELIVLGGWVGTSLGAHLIADTRTALTRHALHRPGQAARIELCRIGRNAVSLGAATFALEGFLATLDAVNPRTPVLRPAGRNAHVRTQSRSPA